jgi:hypothetical protein
LVEFNIPFTGKELTQFFDSKSLKDFAIGTKLARLGGEDLYVAMGKLEDGKYNFDAAQLGNAHNQCRNKAALAMHQQKPTVVIDNTNLTDKERAPYEDLAEKFNYEIIYVVFEPNKQDIKKLARRNLHGVDAAKLEIMAKRFRPPSGTKGRIIYK